MKRKLYIRPTTDIVPILHCRLLDEWSANNGNGDDNGGTVDEDDELSRRQTLWFDEENGENSNMFQSPNLWK